MGRKKKVQGPLPVVLVDEAFMYFPGVDYRYDTEVAEDHDEQCKDDYCRCTTIENFRVTDVNTFEMAGAIVQTFHLPPDMLSMVDRVLRINKLYNTDAWHGHVCGGYYGEELDKVTLGEDVAKSTQKMINDLMELKTLTERVKYLLTAEYGYLLKELEDVTFEERSVDMEDITMGQMDHYKKLDTSVVETYTEYTGVVGVAITQPPSMKVRLLDGYHRVAAANKQNKQEVTMWIGRV